MQGAHIWWAHLEGAIFWVCREDAGLVSALGVEYNLMSAVGLTQAQLETALGDDRTLLPEGLTRPVRWPSAVPAATPGKQPDNAWWQL